MLCQFLGLHLNPDFSSGTPFDPGLQSLWQHPVLKIRPVRWYWSPGVCLQHITAFGCTERKLFWYPSRQKLLFSMVFV